MRVRSAEVRVVMMDCTTLPKPAKARFLSLICSALRKLARRTAPQLNEGAASLLVSSQPACSIGVRRALLVGEPEDRLPELATPNNENCMWAEQQRLHAAPRASSYRRL